MIERIRFAAENYPRQFWLLFWGQIISTIGASMIWPFLMIYVSGKLQLPLTVVASLLTINSAMGLVFSFIAGPITDRFGRKWVMVASLLANALGYLLLSRATQLSEFAVLMGFQGAFNPLFRVGADAMMADLIPEEKRTEAYSLIRMSNNAGIALGPSIGGFIASSSYHLAFIFAAVGMATYGMLLTFLAKETLPAGARHPAHPEGRLGGYGHLFRDKPFISFIPAFILTQMCVALIWTLLGVYMKNNYQIPESRFGLLPTTNALIVVFLQYFVTQFTKHRPPLAMMALGAFLYSIGVGSVAVMQGLWGFWLSMVTISLGELIIVPTSTTYVANLAPAEMRGRYMSLYTLTWGTAAGISPVFGGFLNDNFGVKYPWYGGFLIGMSSVAVYLALRYFFREKPKALSEVPVSED